MSGGKDAHGGAGRGDPTGLLSGPQEYPGDRPGARARAGGDPGGAGGDGARVAALPPAPAQATAGARHHRTARRRVADGGSGRAAQAAAHGHAHLPPPGRGARVRRQRADGAAVRAGVEGGAPRRRNGVRAAGVCAGGGGAVRLGRRRGAHWRCGAARLHLQYPPVLLAQALRVCVPRSAAGVLLRGPRGGLRAVGRGAPAHHVR